MKIIIVHASAGAGHKKAAEALYVYFKQRSPQDKIEIIDILEKTRPFFKKVYIHGYNFLINNCLWLWHFLFWVTSLKFLRGFHSYWSMGLNRIFTAEFSQYIIKENPDLIISTHFLPPEICTCLKQKNKISSQLATVVTDYGIHPFWIHKGTDKYIVASQLSRQILEKQGVEKEKIFVCGIPIDPKFTTVGDKRSICEKIGIRNDIFTVLITTGSSGIGPIEKIVEMLNDGLQVLVVCANNQALFQKLNAKNYAYLKVFGFVNNIEELMRVSDIVIAKPGGMTTSEILCMELVPIFISPIPGQETMNLKVMTELGIGHFPSNINEIKKTIFEYRDNPQKIILQKEKIRKIKKPDAAQEIYNALR